MDLLEIRKKAKEKKEAEARAAEAGAGQQPGEEPRPREEARPAPVKKRPKKKSTGKRETGAARSKPEPAPKPEPDEVPGLSDAILEAASEAAADKTPETGVTAPEEPTAVSAPQRQAVPAAPDELEEVFAGEEEEEYAADEDVIEYLAFMLSGEEYAVKVEDVDEIIRLQKITMVPRADDFVEGIISLRGVIIPVFDIKKRLGLDISERARSTRIVIVSDNDNPQGIIVDKVTGVARLREGSIEPPPAVIGGVEGEYLEGVGRIEDRLLILFNIRKVLDTAAGEN